MICNVPASLFRTWMRRAAEDPEIKPARVIYPSVASDQERRQLRQQRLRHSWRVLTVKRQA